MSEVCLTRGVAEAAAACDDEGWTACLPIREYAGHVHLKKSRAHATYFLAPARGFGPYKYNTA
jgi:hypothetical protein